MSISLKKLILVIFGFNFLFTYSLSFAESGWAAAIMGGLKGYADGRSESLQRQQEYEYQKKLILYRQQLEYERQEQQRQQFLKEQDAIQSRKEAESIAELEEKKRKAKAREIGFMTSLLDLADKNKNTGHSKLTKTIPNWKSLVSSDHFAQWYIKQPNDVMALAESSDPNDAIRLINLFKKSQ